MRVIRCPYCDESLPGRAKYCARCGKSLIFHGLQAVHAASSEDSANLIEHDPFDDMKPWGLGRLDEMKRSSSLKAPHFYPMGTIVKTPQPIDTDENELTQPLHPGKNGSGRHKTRPLHSLDDAEREDTQRIDGLRKLETATPGQWQALSENGTSPELDDSLDVSDDQDTTAPRTWNKVVHTKSSHNTPAGIAVAGAGTSLSPYRFSPTPTRRVRPSLLFWLSTAILLCLLLAGVFGIFATLGRGTATASKHLPSLLVTPRSVALGGKITLHGTNFTPHTKVGLTRDSAIPIFDTAARNTILADDSGSFNDTVVIGSGWPGGQHLIRAEDAHLHKWASFPVMVTGSGIALRPSRLELSQTILDLGSHDQATNNAAIIQLTTAGFEQVSWQSEVTSPTWLLVSPQSGTIPSNSSMNIAIAADRSSLEPGSYTGNVIFTSDAGQATLTVEMQVTQLQTNHEAVLELTPAMLSFTATDGNANPPGQTMTVSNPGVQPLQWSSSSSTSDGSNWLSVSPHSGTITAASSQKVTVNANISSLLPGTYTGSIQFTNGGTTSVVDSPQTIFVSLTILPQCALQVSPASLTFTSAYQQPAPPTQTINLTVPQGCSTALNWTASPSTSNGGNWLTMGSTSGQTPAYPAIGVNSTGLNPGTYTGSIVISSTAGTQTVPVTFIIGKLSEPIMGTPSASVMAFSGIIGQQSPSAQTYSLSNVGGGTLVWNATATTADGSAWLSVSPPSGNLTADQSPLDLNVSATLLSSLTPGTYNGTITIIGTDTSGNPAVGSPQTISVTFNLQAPCTISVSPTALSFTGISGQPDPLPQSATLSASGACGHTLNWSATSGAKWLSTTSTTGTVSPSNPSTINIAASLAGLVPNTYGGSLTITATDSVTSQQIGTALVLKVTLVVLAPCTLQAPSVTTETFTAEAGSTPPTQSFTIGISGSCNGSVLIKSVISTTSGGSWLSVSPSSKKVSSGASATFTASASAAGLAPGSYTGSITLRGWSGGATITGSPQSLTVTLNVIAPPSLTVSPSALHFHMKAGKIRSQAITLGNSGSEPLNWTAAITSNPGFVSLSQTSGTNLAGGTTTSIKVIVDATNASSGTYNATVNITAIDPLTGNPVAGSPASVTITITISAPASMQLSATNLSFKVKNGNNTSSQSITVTNTGGSTLTWSVGTPSATWLTISPSSGSNDPSISSSTTFTVNVADLPKGKYSATVVVTPSDGSAVTINITLKVN